MGALLGGANMQGGNPQQQFIHAVANPVNQVGNAPVNSQVLAMALPIATLVNQSNAPYAEAVVIDPRGNQPLAPARVQQLVGLSEDMGKLLSSISSEPVMPSAPPWYLMRPADSGSPTSVGMPLPSAPPWYLMGESNPVNFKTEDMPIPSAPPLELMRIPSPFGLRGWLQNWATYMSKLKAKIESLFAKADSFFRLEKEVKLSVARMEEAQKAVDKNFRKLKAHLGGLDTLNRLHQEMGYESGGGEPMVTPQTPVKDTRSQDAREWQAILEPMNYFVTESTSCFDTITKISDSLENIMTTQRTLVKFYNRFGGLITSFVLQYLWFFQRITPQYPLEETEKNKAIPDSTPPKQAIAGALAELELSLGLKQDPGLLAHLAESGVVPPMLAHGDVIQKVGDKVHQYSQEGGGKQALLQVETQQKNVYVDLSMLMREFEKNLSPEELGDVTATIKAIKQENKEILRCMNAIYEAGMTVDQCPKKTFLEQFYQELLANTESGKNTI